MSIQRRLQIALAVLGTAWMASMVAALYFGSYRGFARLERDEALRSSSRCVDAIVNEEQSLVNHALDWSMWDDVYQFVEDRNEDFINSSLVPPTYESAGVDMILFVNRGGDLVWGDFEVDRDGEKVTLKSFPEGRWPSDHALVLKDGDNRSSSGIMLTEAGPLLVASGQILTSASTGPNRGTVIMGRPLDSERITKLRDQTHVEFNVVELPNAQLSESVKAFAANASPEAYRIAADSEHGDDDLHVYRVMHDVSGNPALLIDSSIPRKITSEGRLTMIYSLSAVSLLLLFSLVVVHLVLSRYVGGPIHRLVSFVREIGQFSEIHGVNIRTKGDEVTILYNAIHEMLERLRERETQLTSRNRELERAIEEITTLQAILPICSSCKKVRDDQGYWGAVETYFRKKSNVQFSHGYCPECLEKEMAKIQAITRS